MWHLRKIFNVKLYMENIVIWNICQVIVLYIATFTIIISYYFTQLLLECREVSKGISNWQFVCSCQIKQRKRDALIQILGMPVPDRLCPYLLLGARLFIFHRVTMSRCGGFSLIFNLQSSFGYKWLKIMNAYLLFIIQCDPSILKF